MKYKILILGGSGNLGSILKKKVFFKNQFFPTRKEINILNFKKLKKFIFDNKINLIINCAAIARMRECEKSKKKSFNVNVLGAKNLVKIVKQYKNLNIKLIQISSDAVYPSTKGNYSELSKLKPYNYYGKNKLLSEKYVKSLDRFIIIRTRFFNKKKIKYFTAAIDSFTSSIEVNKLANYIILLIKKNFKGIINVGGKKVSDFKLYKNYKKIKICNQADIQKKLKFKISKDASMNISKLNKLFNHDL